jgi:hypothetical protein
VVTAVPAEVVMEIDTPGMSAPEGSAICPRRLAEAAGALVIEVGAATVVEVCPCAAAIPEIPRAKEIKKRVRQCNLEYTNSSMVYACSCVAY